MFQLGLKLIKPGEGCWGEELESFTDAVRKAGLE